MCLWTTIRQDLKGEFERLGYKQCYKQEINDCAYDISNDFDKMNNLEEFKGMCKYLISGLVKDSELDKINYKVIYENIYDYLEDL